ncbi:MAG: PhoX family protein [Acidimicrobiales bacterium]
MIDDGDHKITNRSGNRTFAEVADARLARRRLLKGGMIGAAAFIARPTLAAAEGPHPTSYVPGPASPDPLLSFKPIPTNTTDAVTVPTGYSAQAIVPWGDPIVPGGPAFRGDASNSADEQEQQMGMGHDGVQFFPIDGSSTLGILGVNQEYTNGHLLFPDGGENWTAEKTRKEQAAHGVAIVSVEKGDDGWHVVDTGHARRITPNTPMRFTGWAGGDDLLITNDDATGMHPVGTVNNCGNGTTPWGTLLTCEENFNGYFWEETDGGAEGISDDQAASNERYGVGGQGFGYQWATTDDAWRADLDPNRPNTFGWIVEIDPYDPTSTPMKHTCLGRFKHEAAVVAEDSKGHAVVYMGDDQRFDYVYKFISSHPWRDAVAAGKSPLESGRLYVAQFDDDGTGRWVRLQWWWNGLTPENGFHSHAEVLVKARLAADHVGATPMDRPEWIAVLPGGDVYIACTNNTRREEANAANPRVDNAFGHIVHISEGYESYGAKTFTWDHFLLAGAGDGTDGSTIDAEDVFGSPDGLFADGDGRLWIQTDGSQPDGSHNQMLAADPATGELRRFLVGPADCEVTGAAKTPDGTTMFVSIQHPGDSGTPEEPTAGSTWPEGPSAARPRPAVVAITRNDGGVVG